MRISDWSSDVCSADLVARLRSAQADVAQARAQLQGAQLSLGYTTVTAPISGRAGRAQVTEGALVSAAAGTLLTTIEQANPVYVNFSQSSSENGSASCRERGCQNL